MAVSNAGRVATGALVVSILAYLAYQYPAETTWARLRELYPLGSGDQTHAPGPTGLNHSEIFFGGSDPAAILGPSEGRFTGPRVAVCLVGAARAFELTGPTLKKYLLTAYHDTDVFINSPLDKDSHKFTVLSGSSRLVKARIFIPQRLPENNLQREVLTGANSPNGIQGLLQYFNLVEGCLDMIKEQEKKHNITYDWIVRTRVDGYWSGPLPSFSSFDSNVYYIPDGSNYGGLNDRLGVGSANTSRIALSRLSLLPLIHKHNGRGLNSETAFKAQLDVSKVPFNVSKFPFCILTYRKYSFPPEFWGVPVLSISTKGALNGAKCRPCTPRATGVGAQAIIAKLAKGWGWPGFIEGLELCDAHDDWESQWQKIYEKASGFHLSDNTKKVMTRSVAECMRDVELFQRQWEIWDSPSAKVICSQGNDRRALHELIYEKDNSVEQVEVSKPLCRYSKSCFDG